MHHAGRCATLAALSLAVACTNPRDSEGGGKDASIPKPANPQLQAEHGAAFGIPLVDLSPDRARHVVVDREPGQYLGHPTTQLFPDGTIRVVNPFSTPTGSSPEFVALQLERAVRAVTGETLPAANRQAAYGSAQSKRSRPCSQASGLLKQVSLGEDQSGLPFHGSAFRH